METSEWETQSNAPGTQQEWILLVDDDPQLRRSMREFLETSGFCVLEARNSYDALYAVAQHGQQIRLLITELNLLPVGGVKLAENVIRLWPHIQVICMSAGADNRGLEFWMRYLGAQFLQKPFSPFDLHERVHLALGQHIQDAAISIMDYQATATVATHGQRNGSFENGHGDLDLPTRTGSTDDPMFWLQEP
jgi:DNA-binding response OmpR family regulator